jgi:hypothetical protein
VLNQGAAPPQIAEQAPQILPRAKPCADEYRAMATVCLNWACEPLSKDAHRVCVTLARTCLRAAVCQDAAASDFSRKSPLVFETPGKVLIEDCRNRIKSIGYSFGRPDVRNELCESGGSDPERAYSRPKPALRDSLRVAILALTVGAASGAGAVLAVVRPSAQQQITSLAPQTPMATMEYSVSYSAAELANDRRKDDGETPEPVAPRGTLVAAASPVMGATSPNKSASNGADRTSALDVPSSLERTTTKDPDKAPPHVERKHYTRVTVRHLVWRHRYLFAFLRIW